MAKSVFKIDRKLLAMSEAEFKDELDVSGSRASFNSASFTGSASIASALDVTGRIGGANMSLSKSASIASALNVSKSGTILGGFRAASKVTEGTNILEILAGSVTVATPVFSGNTPASVASTADVAIAGLSASHTFIAMVESCCAMSPCISFRGACPGVAKANFYFNYLAGSGGEAVAADSVTVRFMAFKT